jgi:hypothetical protein
MPLLVIVLNRIGHKTHLVNSRVNSWWNSFSDGYAHFCSTGKKMFEFLSLGMDRMHDDELLKLVCVWFCWLELLQKLVVLCAWICCSIHESRYIYPCCSVNVDDVFISISIDLMLKLSCDPNLSSFIVFYLLVFDCSNRRARKNVTGNGMLNSDFVSKANCGGLPNDRLRWAARRAHRGGGIFFIFFKSFCKTIWPFQIFVDLATNRRWSQRPPRATAVWKVTTIAHGGKGAANGPLRAAGLMAAYRRGPRR